MNKDAGGEKKVGGWGVGGVCWLGGGVGGGGGWGVGGGGGGNHFTEPGEPLLKDPRQRVKHSSANR